MRATLPLIALLAGCTYRKPVSIDTLAPLRAQPARDALVLRASDGGTVRLGAGSMIRFCAASGVCTDWISSDELTVDGDGVYHGGRGWRWSQLDHAEVESIGGGETLLAIVGSAAVLVVVAGVAMLGIAADSVPSDQPPREHESHGDGVASGLLDAMWSSPSYPHGRLGAQLEGDGARPVFAGRARRRAAVRLLAAADGLANRDGDHVESLMLGVRLGEILELGVVGRHVGHRGDTELGAVGGYLGGHFSLDRGDRVAIPIGIDAAFGDGESHWRLRWGLRVRVRRDLFVGAYPLNPTYARGRWIYPSGLEVGITY